MTIKNKVSLILEYAYTKHVALLLSNIVTEKTLEQEENQKMDFVTVRVKNIFAQYFKHIQDIFYEIICK